MESGMYRKTWFVQGACIWLLSLVLFPAIVARGDEETIAASAPAQDLGNLSLEDLMNIEITSVSKQKQKVSQAPAAVTVISQEDIRRSGMTSIPELLRLAPGLDVARVDANKWAITSRGFNDIFANKLLVLMDGRTVYVPVFSGVYWDTVDYVLPDLDRIEVVRGPGATLWGANAVNGVISISTKSARDTQGWLIDARGGTEEQVGAVRYGGKLDQDTYYRVYGKYRTVGDFAQANGDDAHDGWDALRGGFRIDRYASDRDTLTLQGDAYAQREGQTAALPTFVPPTFRSRIDDVNNESGGNVLARWTHVISPTSDFSLQMYYDNVSRSDFFGGYSLHTFDVDFQHRFELTRGQELIWGGGFRFNRDHITGKNGIVAMPDSRDAYIVSAFAQDDITLVPDRLHLVLGSKFEQNSYTGFEFQPSARMVWTPNDRNSFWGAISRAVRTPNRGDEDLRATIFKAIEPTSGLPLQMDVVGNNQLYSEHLLAYELGYRSQVNKAVSVDVSGFYNRYDNLLSLEPNAPALLFTPPVPHLVISAPWGNKRKADAYGAEVAVNWMVTDNWRLNASYTWLTLLVHSTSSDRSPQPESGIEDAVPRNQIQIRSYLDITKNLEFNAAAYYVENLAATNVPSYIRVDLGLTWRPKKDVEMSVGVQNLLDDRHPEFGGQFGVASTEMQRAVYGQLLVRF
jgi:iron complex outermembrane receptor protein